MIQNKEKYFKQMKQYLSAFAKGKKMQIFLFGSAVRQERFADVDIGIKGDEAEKDIRELKELFEESTFPFKIDIVNFNTVQESFKKNVLLNNKLIWIKR